MWGCCPSHWLEFALCLVPLPILVLKLSSFPCAPSFPLLSFSFVRLTIKNCMCDLSRSFICGWFSLALLFVVPSLLPHFRISTLYEPCVLSAIPSCSFSLPSWFISLPPFDLDHANHIFSIIAPISSRRFGTCFHVWRRTAERDALHSRRRNIPRSEGA